MSDSTDFEQRLQAIRAHDQREREIRNYNEPLLAEWQAWLAHEGLAAKKIARYRSNVRLFSMYLTTYAPLRPLDEATSADVSRFLSYWYPRKVMGATPTGVVSHYASFKWLFRWLGEAGRASPERVAAVASVLKQRRAESLAAVTK